MKRLKFIYIGFALMAAACSEGEAGSYAPDRNIQLSVSIGDIETSSRAQDPDLGGNPAEDNTAETPVQAIPYLGSTPSETNPFETAIWFRKEGNATYKTDQTEPTFPVHTSVKFTRPQLEYVYRDAATSTYNLQYPIDNTPDDNTVYCVGFYPKDREWEESTDGQTVSHSIDGQTDLMFASEKSGTWANHFPPLEYKHLLTWIKIAVCATSHDTAEAWGDIKEITISGKSGLKIDLLNKTCTYEGDVSRTVKLLNPDNPDNPNVQINTTMREVGSIFCSPETSYTLTIKTANNTEAKTVRLDLKDMLGRPLTDTSQAQGNCFVLSLYFKPYNVIEGACSLNAWSNQNEDIYLKPEEPATEQL